LTLAQELIRIDSQNPPGDESRIASFVKRYLANLGLKTRIYEFKKKRANVIAVLEGKYNKRSLLVTPHLDTVPAGISWKFPPFSPSIRQGKLYGLGATDCKGNLAVGLEAINSLVDDRVILGYNLVFAATADEEAGSSLGLAPLLDKEILKPDAALVLDADDFEIIVVQKGLLHFKVKIQGKKAHGAYPWMGVNAIAAAVDILGELKNRRFACAANRYLRPPTLNIGTIKGGDKVNVVADWCEFELDFRFLPGQSARKILTDIKKIIRRYSRKFQLEIEGIQEPYLIARDHPLVDCLSRAMKKKRVRPRIRGSEGATTISFFQDKNIPAIATGFGSQGLAHTADEYARVDNLHKGAEVLEYFLKSYKFI
jgi:acetylornithine deacetylase/succinyl-diaminopimelate desuccinylase family protein